MGFNCKDIHALASDYLDGRLTFMQRVNFRVHLFICGPCARFIKQMRATIAALAQLPRREPSAEDVENQVARLRDLHKPDGH